MQAAAQQRRLIDAAVALLRPGGTLVYSTCTLNPGLLPPPPSPQSLPAQPQPPGQGHLCTSAKAAQPRLLCARLSVMHRVGSAHAGSSSDC